MAQVIHGNTPSQRELAMQEAVDAGISFLDQRPTKVQNPLMGILDETPSANTMPEQNPYVGILDQTPSPQTLTPQEAYDQAELRRFQNQYAQAPVNPPAQPLFYTPSDAGNQLTVGYGGGGGAGANQFAVPRDLTNLLTSLYADLETTAQTELGSLSTQDFSDQIQELIESGRLSAQDLNQLQQQNIVDAEGRAVANIDQIQAEVLANLQGQEEDRRAIQEELARESDMRTRDFEGRAADRIAAARGTLGPAVSSEFEEVAELTSGLTASQAQSNAASASRLRQVAGMAAAERLAAPAQLAAEAKMAVGDQKFKMQNQLRIQLAQNMAQLDTSEREMLLQESMRQEQFGVQRDQALANAMFQIAQQRNQALLGEQTRLDTIQQRQSEILQQQGFQQQMARESRAAASAASAKQEAQMEAAKQERDAWLYERIANEEGGAFQGFTPEQYDKLPEGFKQSLYEAEVGYELGTTYPPAALMAEQWMPPEVEEQEPIPTPSQVVEDRMARGTSHNANLARSAIAILNPYVPDFLTQVGTAPVDADPQDINEWITDNQEEYNEIIAKVSNITQGANMGNVNSLEKGVVQNIFNNLIMEHIAYAKNLEAQANSGS